MGGAGRAITARRLGAALMPLLYQPRATLAAYVPWADDAPRRRRRGPFGAHFTFLYILAAWVVFLPGARRVPGNYLADLDRFDAFLYRIPDLSEDLPRLLRSLVIAPWLSHNAVQLVYVTALLLLAGVAFERREGTVRTVAVFFGTTWAGALGAGALLHLIYPEIVDNAFFAEAWHEGWSGGSAGCFGLLGAVAARTRNPWPLLAICVFWEANVVYWYLREYTPVFHMIALAVGFAGVRALPVGAERSRA